MMLMAIMAAAAAAASPITAPGPQGPLEGTLLDAGAKTPEGLTVAQLHRLIRETGRDPVERDTLYRRVVRKGADWSVAEAV